jgi:hypothetical protein
MAKIADVIAKYACHVREIADEMSTAVFKLHQYAMRTLFCPKRNINKYWLTY